MKRIAIIPARGGSKRIPQKNIKKFHGKPIIQYSIEMALNSGLFDEVMVSTENEEIAKVSKKAGASIPFFRSQKNANDHAGFADVISEVLENYKKLDQTFEYFCLILSTAPFITIKLIEKGFQKLENNNLDSVFPVIKYNEPIQRALKIENDKLSMIWPENMHVRSQDLTPAFHDSGMFYWMKTDAFMEQRKIYADKSGAIVISNFEAHDIDTEEDWKLAEMKYDLIKHDE